jgi:hypothetical protein
VPNSTGPSQTPYAATAHTHPRTCTRLYMFAYTSLALWVQLNEACGTTQSETMWTSGANTNRVIMSKGLDNRATYLYSSAVRGHTAHLHGKFVNVYAHIYEPVRNAKAVGNVQVSPCRAACVKAKACATYLHTSKNALSLLLRPHPHSFDAAGRWLQRRRGTLRRPRVYRPLLCRHDGPGRWDDRLRSWRGLMPGRARRHPLCAYYY